MIEKCPLCGRMAPFPSSLEREMYGPNVSEYKPYDHTEEKERYDKKIILEFLKELTKECIPHGQWVYNYAKKKLEVEK